MSDQLQPPVSFVTRIIGSAFFKLCLIGLLTLLLLIPSYQVEQLIEERQNRQDSVNKEVAEKWSGSQRIEGPVMVLPYKTLISQKDTSGKLSFKTALTNIYILPENLNIESKISPEILHRGIFDAVVYHAKIKLSGNFSALELRKSGINPDMILWDKAKVVFGVSDVKGLKNNVSIQLADTNYQVEPDFQSLKLFKNNLVVLPDLSVVKNTALDFSFDLNLRGSNEIRFIPIGKNMNVKVEGLWKNPSFTGHYLPEKRDITPTSFSAQWQIPFFNRPFPQQWIDPNIDLLQKTSGQADFGVNFLLPVDQYQKTMRTAKYATLIILLTFISLFFTELITKTRVHILQYVLIGAAMIIFYLLLLSLSEQIGFNLAYLIASVATIILLAVFINSLIRRKKTAIMFSIILTIFYSFIFIILQLQDFALLFGSLGLFIIISAAMYFSTKIDWNKD
jgi:inner membrane protein